MEIKGADSFIGGFEIIGDQPKVGDQPEVDETKEASATDSADSVEKSAKTDDSGFEDVSMDDFVKAQPLRNAKTVKMDNSLKGVLSREVSKRHCGFVQAVLSLARKLMGVCHSVFRGSDERFHAAAAASFDKSGAAARDGWKDQYDPVKGNLFALEPKEFKDEEIILGLGLSGTPERKAFSADEVEQIRTGRFSLADIKQDPALQDCWFLSSVSAFMSAHGSSAISDLIYVPQASEGGNPPEHALVKLGNDVYKVPLASIQVDGGNAVSKSRPWVQVLEVAMQMHLLAHAEKFEFEGVASFGDNPHMALRNSNCAFAALMGAEPGPVGRMNSAVEVRNPRIELIKKFFDASRPIVLGSPDSLGKSLTTGISPKHAIAVLDVNDEGGGKGTVTVLDPYGKTVVLDAADLDGFTMVAATPGRVDPRLADPQGDLPDDRQEIMKICGDDIAAAVSLDEVAELLGAKVADVRAMRVDEEKSDRGLVSVQVKIGKNRTEEFLVKRETGDIGMPGEFPTPEDIAALKEKLDECSVGGSFLAPFIRNKDCISVTALLTRMLAYKGVHQQQAAFAFSMMLTVIQPALARAREIQPHGEISIKTWWQSMNLPGKAPAEDDPHLNEKLLDSWLRRIVTDYKENAGLTTEETKLLMLDYDQSCDVYDRPGYEDDGMFNPDREELEERQADYKGKMEKALGAEKCAEVKSGFFAYTTDSITLTYEKKLEALKLDLHKTPIDRFPTADWFIDGTRWGIEKLKAVEEYTPAQFNFFTDSRAYGTKYSLNGTVIHEVAPKQSTEASEKARGLYRAAGFTDPQIYALVMALNNSEFTATTVVGGTTSQYECEVDAKPGADGKMIATFRQPVVVKDPNTGGLVKTNVTVTHTVTFDPSGKAVDAQLKYERDETQPSEQPFDRKTE